MANQSLKTAFDAIIRKMNLPGNSYTDYSKKNSQLGYNNFKEEISVMDKLIEFTTGDPQFALNHGDVAPEQVAVVAKFPFFTVGYTQIQTHPTVTQNLDKNILPFDVFMATLILHKQTVDFEYGQYVAKDWAIKPFSPDTAINTNAANFSTGKYKNKFLLTTGQQKNSALQSTPTPVRKITYEDIVRVNAALGDQNMTEVPKYALVTSDQLADIQNLAKLEYQVTGEKMDIFGKLRQYIFGIFWIERGGSESGATNVVYQNNAGSYTPLPYGALTTGDSRNAILFWTEGSVWSSDADNVEIFTQTGDPKYYGDVNSMQKILAAYKDNEITQDGVCVLVEADI
jgi:hypothetical protein